ncbi:MAG: hypothetical protein KDE59_18915 [Anaerolineales bacterium]|nr:hypothetical protein [Anaerolineales bacterium]MCB0009198.1 hypothetical protein [Anaerolineales bacterium]
MEPTTQPGGPLQQGQTLDPEYLRLFREHLRGQQSLILGALAGAGAAFLGAIMWAGISYISGYQIGFLAIAIGMLVGYAIASLGRGIDKIYGWMGGGFSLLGVIAGNLFTVAVYITQAEEMPIWEVGFLMLLNPGLTLEIMMDTFSPMDLLFYGLAIYYGYRSSFRKVTTRDEAAFRQHLNPGRALNEHTLG